MANRKIGQEIKRIPIDERLNPKVIREFLHEWVTEDFDRDVTLASQAVANAQKNSGRSYKSSLKGETIYDIISDRSQIRYVHLDGLAKLLGVPTCLILAFTRIRSEIEQSPSDLNKALDIIDSLSACLQEMKANILSAEIDSAIFEKPIDKFHYRDFKNLIELYNMSTEQPTLL